MNVWGKEKQREYIKETDKFISPIANEINHPISYTFFEKLSGIKKEHSKEEQ